MLSVLQRSNALVRRCTRDLLYANTLQLPRRQQKLAANSFQTYHYSSSATIPKERHVWTNDETRKLVEHVKSEYYSLKRKPSWKNVSEHFGIPIRVCQSMYYYSRNIDFTKEDLEVDQDYAKDSKYIVKAVFDGAKKLASSQAMWTTDEVARLHEARGDRNKKPVQGGWASIAEYVGTGKSIGQCQYKWDRLCHVDDLKALGDNQNNSTAANGATNTKENYRAWWTPDEIMQLKALFDTPFDRKNPRLRIAYALFPQMPQAQVRYTMENLRSAWDTRRRRTHASESQPLLQKLVSDSGGAEKADWEAISKEIGFDSLSVPKDLPQDNCGKV